MQDAARGTRSLRQTSPAPEGIDSYGKGTTPLEKDFSIGGEIRRELNPSKPSPRQCRSPSRNRDGRVYLTDPKRVFGSDRKYRNAALKTQTAPTH